MTEPVLNLSAGRPSPMLERVVEDGRAWRRDTVSADDWTLTLPAAALAEIREAAQALRRDPLPLLLLRKEDFSLAACGEVMARLRGILAEGIGVGVVDAMPLDEMEVEEAKAVYWLLGQFVGREVAQKWDGTMVYDVTNTGTPHGYGVRRSWTDLELNFHTDNAFAVAPPDYVSLLCLSTAKEGGISRFCSLYTVHNEMLRRYPKLLARLYRPFYYDRQAEHAPGEPKVSFTPAFRFDGRALKARLASTLVRGGYELMGESLDEEGREAWEAVDEIAANPELWIEFRIERGQMQYLNNWECGHFRSTFVDDEAAGLKRHLIRLWYRDQGRPTYDG